MRCLACDSEGWIKTNWGKMRCSCNKDKATEQESVDNDSYHSGEEISRKSRIGVDDYE